MHAAVALQEATTSAQVPSSYAVMLYALAVYRATALSALT
jgi:hypothetical protein